MNCCVKAKQGTPKRDVDTNSCIEVTHIGSHDAPVGRLRLCTGQTGSSRADSLHQNNWTFYFDAATFDRLTDFVIKNSSQGPIDLRNDPQSSFSVTWRSNDGAHKYIVQPRLACAYLSGVVKTVTGAEYAEFRDVGKDMMAREGCDQQAAPPS